MEVLRSFASDYFRFNCYGPLGANPVELLRTPDAERVYRYLDAVMKNELRLPLRWRRDH